MAEAPPLRRPSDEVSELKQQLLRELEGIHRDGDSWREPTLFRAYLQHAQALAWQGAVNGDLNAPREILDHLLAAQPFVDSHLPASVGLAAQAAQEVHQTIRSLYLADQVLEEARTKARLADRDRSRTEREILRILFENRDTYLRRGAVRARMDPSSRPTPARVGQILVDLHEEGLVLRTHGRAQGSPSAAFYALSPRGFELCQSLGLDDMRAKSAWIHRILEKIVASDSTPEQRKMLIDSLSTASDPAIGDLVIQMLEDLIQQKNDEENARLYKYVLLSVLLARRKIDFAASVAPPGSGGTGSGPGVYILKSRGEVPPDLLSESIVNAFILDLEEDMKSVNRKATQDGLIHILRDERNRLLPDRALTTASHSHG
jgi:hypothetical protein